mgnify:CR=1 FL=1
MRKAADESQVFKEKCAVFENTDRADTDHARQNEQALQLSVENLVDGDARAVYKSTSFDFRYYKKLSMFVHAEKMNEYDDIEDGDLTVFLRFGSDLTDNYYEYEVPLKFTEWYTSSTDDFAIWPEENNIEINFEELVEVKNNRNKSIGINNVQTNRVYSENFGKKKIKVLGNPTISEVRSMMIGIRNPRNENEVGTDKSAIVWINELRLTDLNNQGGWAATGRIEATLADLGRVSASGSYNSAGYGALETKVTDSKMESNGYYNVSTDYLLSIENKRYLDVTDLSEDTIQHLQLIIDDIKKSAKE